MLARDGIFNARDLGGLPTADGGVLASGRLVRADALQRASLSLPLLETYGIVRVLDLRDEAEREAAGVLVADGIDVQHHPVLDPTFAWHDDDHDEPATLLGTRYRVILESFSARFVRAVESITEVLNPPDEAANGAVAFHCAVGKDRTGLLTALILDSLGVEDDVIAADYARSSAATAVQVSWLWTFGLPQGSATDDDLATGVWSARPETMAATLGWLDDEFGGARSYLLQHGLEADTLDRLHAAMVETPTA